MGSAPSTCSIAPPWTSCCASARGAASSTPSCCSTSGCRSRAASVGPEALRELALRYFRSRGPATVQDFQWWSGLPAADARAGLEHARKELQEARFDERPHFMAPGAEPGGAPAGVHLLPGFDEYLIAYKDRRAALDPEHARLVNSGGGMLYPALVSRGRVVGTWKRTLGKGTVTVASSPFAPLRGAETRAAAACSRRFADFLGLKSVFE